MELTKEQMDKIVYQVTEKVLLRIPEVLGNLMQNKAATMKLYEKFYAENPDFKSDPLAVRSVVAKNEQANPDKTYKEILDLSVPEIKQRMSINNSLDIKKVKKIDELSLTTNGVI